MIVENAYCSVLGISVPSVGTAARSGEANGYALLIAVLLERGGPVTLEQAAQRLAVAGLGSADGLLRSLKHCKPARPPIYRDGDQYSLDPYHDEASLWAFRLGLRQPRSAPCRLSEPETVSAPLPGPDVPLTQDELAEAWRRYVPMGFSAQRLAVAVLDAHGRPMTPEEVVAYVEARTDRGRLSMGAARHWGRDPAISVREDGWWELRPDHDAVRSARRAVRVLIEAERRAAHRRPCPAAVAAVQQRLDRERDDHAAALARMRRVLICACPADRPEAVVLLDVERRQIETLSGGELDQVGERLSPYDIVAGVDVRYVLRQLGFDPGTRRLHEIGLPQKTWRLNRRGRVLKITMALVVGGSCGIGRPFGDTARTLAYLRDGQQAKFRRRLEADAKSVLALYQYGRLHHGVRLRWGFLDEMLPAPWAQRDEPSFRDLMQRSNELDVPLDVVVGSAPGWEEPWSRARLVRARKNPGGWGYALVDEDGRWVNERDVQAARLTRAGAGTGVES